MIVQPAQRSVAARDKAARKRTLDDLPVHSFRDLLAELGTPTANEMEVSDQGPTFIIDPELIPVQQRSFDLLAVSHRM